MRIVAADTGIPYEINVGDSVELIGSIRPYNGGRIVHGPDTGHIMDIRDKVERLAIKWQQARFGGWDDAQDLSQVPTLQKPSSASSPPQQQATPIPQKKSSARPTFQVCDRVQASQAIYSPSCGVTVGKGTEGNVVRVGRQSVSVRWDQGPEFVYVNPALLVTSSGQAQTPAPSTSQNPSNNPADTSDATHSASGSPPTGRLTSESEMLTYPSIQELLIALGFADDQDTGEMCNAQTADAIPFANIAGRSVGEFVRQGLKAGWLTDYLRPEEHDLAA